MHAFVSNENMLLVKDLIVAIEEGSDGAERVRWLLDDGGYRFEDLRQQLNSVDFGDVDPAANGFKLICLWAAVDGNAPLLKLLLSKMEDRPVEAYCEKTEFAQRCFDLSCRFNRVNCAEVAYFECGDTKIDEMHVHLSRNPLVYATERNMKEMVRFLLKVGANPLVISGWSTPIEIAKELKDKDIYFMLTTAAEGRSKLGFKFRLFTREMKWPRL